MVLSQYTTLVRYEMISAEILPDIIWFLQRDSWIILVYCCVW